MKTFGLCFSALKKDDPLVLKTHCWRPAIEYVKCIVLNEEELIDWANKNCQSNSIKEAIKEAIDCFRPGSTCSVFLDCRDGEFIFWRIK